MKFFPVFWGFMPLAATHYNFIREIPMFALFSHGIINGYVFPPIIFSILTIMKNYIAVCRAEVRHQTQEVAKVIKIYGGDRGTQL